MKELFTREGKGSPLEHSELDANMVELQRRTGEGWNDLVSDVTIQPGAAAPVPATFRDGLVLYAFPSDTIAECFANFHLRHDYVDGTMLYPHVHWSHNTTGVGVVRWGVEWTFARRADSPTGVIAFGPTQTFYIEHDVAANEQYHHHVNESAEGAGIFHADLMVDTLVLCRFFRDAAHPNDTFPDHVFLLTVDLHYQCNSLATPLRTPPFF